MKATITVIAAFVASLFVGTPAWAKVVHGYSGILMIDTVAAVRDGGSDTPASAARISSIHPNPFNPRTTVKYELVDPDQVDLAIFDARGRRVRTLASWAAPAGHHSSIWTGVDDTGRMVPTGVYFCRLDTPRGSETRKLTLAR